MDFPKRQLHYVNKLYKGANSFGDFVSKAMQVDSEAFKAECEFASANKLVCSTFLNWMFDDIWSSGTWPTVDYYLEPKQIYYQMKKSYKPIIFSFYEDEKGFTHLFGVNNTLKDEKIKIEYYLKTFEGNLLEPKKCEILLSNEKNFDLKLLIKKTKPSNYLYVSYLINKEKRTSIDSNKFFSNYYFKNEFPFATKILNKNHVDIKIKAKTFVKSLFVNFKDNYKYLFSDNYLDLEKGETKIIHVGDKYPIDMKTLKFSSFRGLK